MKAIAVIIIILLVSAFASFSFRKAPYGMCSNSDPKNILVQATQFGLIGT